MSCLCPEPKGVLYQARSGGLRAARLLFRKPSLKKVDNYKNAFYTFICTELLHTIMH